MKIGQSVKVRTRPAMEVKGQQIPELWQRGVVKTVSYTGSDQKPSGFNIAYGEFSSYTEQDFPASDVVKHTPLSDEAQEANIARDLPIGLALANELIKQFLPSHPEVTLDGENLVGYKGGITIDPVTIDQKTIGGLVERTAWEVVSWSWEGGGRWHPEENVDSAVGTYRSIGEAVEAMIKAIFAMELEGYLTAKGEQDMAEQWKLDEA